jgi:hypothetical protein
VTFTADDERFHAPGSEQQWSDSLYFGGAGESGLALYSRIGLRPNEGAIEGAVGIWLPDGRFVLSFAREDARPQAAAGAVSFDCALPFELWRIRLSGRGRVFARAEDLALRGAGEDVEIGGELRFCAWTPPIGFERGLTGAVATTHYEQPGSLAGTLRVAGERFPVAGRGLRDHSWGVRDWQAVPYWRWFGMVVDPDTFLLVNNVGTPDGGETAGGHLMLGGELSPVAACRTESETRDDLGGAQSRFRAAVRDELGRETVLEGEALSVAPLRQRRNGRLTHVFEALTRLRWEGREGLGISEYLIQADARCQS